MFEKIFEEIFGDVDWEKFAEKMKDFEEKNNAENDSKSYFHTIEDEYEDGKHVLHKEKEVKDGKVIKDINDNCLITKQDEDKTIENEAFNTDVEIRELKAENKRLLKEIENKNETIRKFKGCIRTNEMTIERQNNDLERLLNKNKELNEKLDNIKMLF
jgi:hypothetical protein